MPLDNPKKHAALPIITKRKRYDSCDFLSRQEHDDSNLHKISFYMQNMLHSRYYNINEREQGKYLVQTRSQAKTSYIMLREVHGIYKGTDTNVGLGKTSYKASSYTTNTYFA